MALEDQERKVTEEKLRMQINRYREFIRDTVQVNNVLEKAFYVIIPMSFLELGIASTVSSRLKNKHGKHGETLNLSCMSYGDGKLT